ncbi:MAG: hypothetical protein FJW66_02060 [Actinobacteria bacterium]|nr:hypothetical protein [Actinomycetota bacterium]
MFGLIKYPFLSMAPNLSASPSRAIPRSKLFSITAFLKQERFFSEGSGSLPPNRTSRKSFSTAAFKPSISLSISGIRTLDAPNIVSTAIAGLILRIRAGSTRLNSFFLYPEKSEIYSISFTAASFFITVPL